MTLSRILTTIALASLTTTQQIGLIPEIHPKLLTSICTTTHGCTKHPTSVVLDGLYHPIHEKGNINNTCTTTGNSTTNLNPNFCTSKKSCAENCVIEGVNYQSHGVSTNTTSITLHQYTNHNSTTTPVSPRVYLFSPNGENYESLHLQNQELTFDIDASSLPCGINGALYLTSMSETGGRSTLNDAGARYGTGYCDAQCPVLPWVNGEANIEGVGACCSEVDIWEGNKVATAYTAHPCNVTGLYGCLGDECGSQGLCDQIGCGFNPYQLGQRGFYGVGGVVDTSRVFTVVTQFVNVDGGGGDGDLVQIRRLYVQDGKVVHNAVVEVDGEEIDSVSEEYCSRSAGYFEKTGGFKRVGSALERGMVLVMSIWADPGDFMNWLDSGSAGPCNSTEGDPALIQEEYPETKVTFSNIRWGDIGSTYSEI